MEIKLKLKPLSVPNFVIAESRPSTRQEGWKESSSFPLSDLDAETLNEMCNEFRRNVFAKAGIEPPKD